MERAVLRAAGEELLPALSPADALGKASVEYVPCRGADTSSTVCVLTTRLAQSLGQQSAISGKGLRIVQCPEPSHTSDHAPRSGSLSVDSRRAVCVVSTAAEVMDYIGRVFLSFAHLRNSSNTRNDRTDLPIPTVALGLVYASPAARPVTPGMASSTLKFCDILVSIHTPNPPEQS